MATSVNFFQPGTEAAIDANQILRQRKMAELLMQQGTQSPQGQMVSGHYVAPGALSYVNQIAQALGGRYMADKADERELELGKQMRARNAAEVQEFTRAMQGTPATSREIDGPAAPGQAAPTQTTAAIPPDQNRALALALGGQNPLLQQMAPEIMKRQMDAAEFAQAMQAAQGGPAVGGGTGAPAAGAAPIAGTPGAPAAGGNTFGLNPAAFAFSSSPNARAQAIGKMVQEASKPQTLAEGGTLVTPDGRIVMTAPKTEAGIAVQNGQAQPIPGFAEAQARRAGLTAGAEAAAKDPYAGLVRIGDRWLTPAQARAEAQGGGAPARPAVQPAPSGPVVGGLPQAQSGMSGAFMAGPNGKVDVDRAMMAIQSIGDPQEKANALAGLQKQIASEASAPVVGGQGGPGIPVPNESAQAYATSRAKSYAEQAPKLQQAGQDASSQLRNLEQLETLYRDPNVAKGALAESISGLKNLGASFGIDMKGLSSEQAAEAITNKMALASRSTAEGGGMPGAMSDADRKFLANMQPGLNKTPEGRAKIIDASRKVAQRQIDVSNMARQYEQQNGQLDIGFDKVLADYAQKNQMFTGNAPRVKILKIE